MEKDITFYSDKINKINLYYEPNFLNKKESIDLYNIIYTNAPWSKNHLTKTGKISKTRNKVIIGDDDIINKYIITYKGIVIKTKVWSWTKLPFLKNLRDKISEKTGQKYHCCVIQLYNNGSVGIKPHRDKEMLSGSIIASISLGATRVMKFERYGYEDIDIKLKTGSLFLINPPTNDYWLHSIPWDKYCEKGRMSLIFRNCENMI